MIAAPVGTQIDGYTLPAPCGAPGRYPLCLMHGHTFPDAGELATHVQKLRKEYPPCVVGWLCSVHGPEAQR
jgi:hypothetical protein